MQRTSEITITDVDVKPIRKDFQFEDRYATMYEPLFTEFVRTTPTPHHECFKYFTGDTIIGQSLKLYGEYTDTEVQVLHSFCNDETIVYDIGANIGYHTVGLAKRSKYVFAFEPNLKNFKLLSQNTFHCDNVTNFNCAASNINGYGKIEDFVLGSEGNHGELSISDKGQKCPLVKIDDFVKEHKLPIPHIVKIDVEGHEWQVVQGMQDIIKNNLPVVFYEHLHGNDLEKVSDYLDSLGYKQFWFPAANYNPNNFKKNKENIFGNGGVLNVLAVPFHIQLQSMLPEKVKGESWQQLCERYQKQNAK